MMSACIWCNRINRTAAIEHIIPEPLGCPEGFVLSGGTVCEKCNNDLAHLDQAVIDDFDLICFMNNIPRKRGRPPIVKNRGNLLATMGDKGFEITINSEKYPVIAHDGSRLAPIGGSSRNVHAKFTKVGNKGKISFSVKIGNNPKFARGILKIAFSALAFYLGGEFALSEGFDPVRSFVRKGSGHRPILMKSCEDVEYKNQVWPPYKSDLDEYIVILRLAMAEFYVDLSRDVSVFPRLREEMQKRLGKSGWTTIPVG